VLVPSFKRAAQLIVTGAVVLAAGSLPPAAHAQTSAPTLTASGTASTAPEPQNRRSEASIRKAVAAAEAEALPTAVSKARAHATALAAAAGVTLGALISIADAPTNSFPYYYSFGTFPNGHFCGTVRKTRVVVRDGKRRRVSAGTRRTCRVPPQVFSAVQLTYAISPPS
jgi:uncharacterized protein YggE